MVNFASSQIFMPQMHHNQSKSNKTIQGYGLAPKPSHSPRVITCRPSVDHKEWSVELRFLPPTTLRPLWPVSTHTQMARASNRIRIAFTKLVILRIVWTNFDQALTGSNSPSSLQIGPTHSPTSHTHKRSSQATCFRDPVPIQFIYHNSYLLQIQIRVQVE